jgi:signal transduction histidine kinase
MRKLAGSSSDYRHERITGPAKRTMNAWWRARPSKHGQPTWPCVVALLALPIVAVANYYAGSEISFLIFYLPWIALVGWLGGSWLGALAAVEATTAWLIVDLKTGQRFSDPAIPYWNAALHFAVFLMFGLLFAILRQNSDRLEQAVLQKTSELQKEITERTRIQREVADIFANQQRQIAYDLHDGVGQHLSGVAFKSKLLEQKLRAEESQQADEAAAITTLINDALRQTRVVARGMESTYGEARGLGEALQKFAGELRDRLQVSATVNIDGLAEAVAAPADVQLFRIAQEAVHNATEHGGARNIEIELRSNGDGVLLRVRDDGRGFDGIPAGAGMGMRTMQYRAQTLGGSLAVQSEPGAGTTISCSVPKRRTDGKATVKLSA